MNKVVCNLCGTSYPENATQCPICGYARSAETSSGNSGEGKYTYVKGGRFSKANVKKRNQAAGTAKETIAVSQKKDKKTGAGLTIVIIVLLLAIVAVLGYIALRFFLPNDFIFEGFDNLKVPASSQEAENTEPSSDAEEQADAPSEETEPDLSCKSLQLNQSELTFAEIGAEAQLTVELEPVDTTDQLTFTSSDPSIVTVAADGTVKAVAEGSAVITVSCGAVSEECAVTVTVPSEPQVSISLNRKEITFTVEGQSWILYDGDIPAADIVWTSDNNDVAQINNGKVVAIGNGDTTVYAVYDGQSYSCVIHCNLDEEASGESGNITEAGGETKRAYKLYNPTGFADDVTLRVGERFTLKLVDENTEEVTDAQWNIEDAEVCSYKDSIVEALEVGTTEITATYEGVTYTCLVRVI